MKLSIVCQRITLVPNTSVHGMKITGIPLVPWDLTGTMGFHWYHGIPLVPWDSTGTMGSHWYHGISLVPWDSHGKGNVYGNVK